MLKECNEILEQHLKEVDWPFLGLFGELLDKDMRRVAMMAIMNARSVEGYCLHLKKFPALFSIYLCRVLMQTFGQHDYFQLWPEIQKALYLKEAPTDAEKSELWLAFRSACKKLGLEVSPRTEGTHYRVDEFLRQVGLSIHHANDLATKMLRFARRQGIPDEDNPQSVLTWQAALCQTLNTQFSRAARDAVMLDRKGYYTQSFLRVYYAPEIVGSSASLLDRAFAEALLAPDAKGQRVIRAAIPQVLLQNEMIGVLLPGGEARDWKVMVDDTAHLLRSGASDQFVPLEESLPKSISIYDDSGLKLVDSPLWEDEKNNRVILFSADTGHIVARGALAAPDLVVPPGRYWLMARFEPQAEAVEYWQLSDDPALFLLPVTLGPGQKFQLSRGSVCFRMGATSEPLLVWQGQSFTSQDGHQIFRATGLQVKIQVPSDQIAFGARFEADVSLGQVGERETVLVAFTEDGMGELELGEISSRVKWSPGVWRCHVQLRRAGEARSVGKLSGFCWVGLNDIQPGPRFVLSEAPKNLLLPASDNAQLASSEIRCADAGRRSVRLVFALDARREAAFTWMVPGVFLELLEYDSERRAIRKPLAVGTTLLASALSCGQLIISSTDVATIKLGGLQRYRDFGRSGAMILPLGALADQITPQSSELVYCSEKTGNSITLVRLIRPQEILSFTIKPDRNQALVRFKTADPVYMVQIRLVNLVSGDVQTLFADLLDEQVEHDAREKVQFLQTPTEDGVQSTTAIIPARNLETGLWMASFEVRQASGWGRLSNARGDYYTVGIVVGEDREILSNGFVESGLALVSRGSSAAIFQRVHEALQYCYAPESWPSISWLVPLWRNLLSDIAATGDSEKLQLLGWATQVPNDVSSPSWIPQVTILSRLPKLLAEPARTYLEADGDGLLHQSLKMLGGLPACLASSFNADIHISLALAFGNAPAIAIQQAHPVQFDVKKYHESLLERDDRASAYLISDDDYVPGSGEWLGPLHSRFVKHQLEERWARTQGGNELRRGQAIGMTRRAERYSRKLTLHGQTMDWIASPWEREADEFTPDSVRERLDLLRPLEHFISAFAWHCRLETRQSGALSKFLNGIAEPGVDGESSLGFLLHVGEAMLGFYLLLWEFVQRAEFDAAPRFNRIPAHA
jgi:hypothetical protein